MGAVRDPALRRAGLRLQRLFCPLSGSARRKARPLRRPSAGDELDRRRGRDLAAGRPDSLQDAPGARRQAPRRLHQRPARLHDPQDPVAQAGRGHLPRHRRPGGLGLGQRLQFRGQCVQQRRSAREHPESPEHRAGIRLHLGQGPGLRRDPAGHRQWRDPGELPDALRGHRPDPPVELRLHPLGPERRDQRVRVAVEGRGVLLRSGGQHALLHPPGRGRPPHRRGRGAPARAAHRRPRLQAHGALRGEHRLRRDQVRLFRLEPGGGGRLPRQLHPAGLHHPDQVFRPVAQRPLPRL